MNKKNAAKLIPLFLAFSPLVASAQFSGIRDLLRVTGDLVNYAIGLLLAVAILVFFWGLVKFIKKAGEGDVKEGKDLMVWGLIAIFVMLSYMGIIGFFQRELNLPGTGSSILPSRPFNDGTLRAPNVSGNQSGQQPGNNAFPGLTDI